MKLLGRDIDTFIPPEVLEQEDLFKTLIQRVNRAKHTQANVGRLTLYKKTAGIVRFMGGDQRDLFKMLHDKVESTCDPSVIVEAWKMMEVQGKQNISEILTESVLLDIAVMKEALGPSLGFNFLGSPSAAEARRIITHVIAADDPESLIAIIKERSPADLEALQELAAAITPHTPPLRSGSL